MGIVMYTKSKRHPFEFDMGYVGFGRLRCHIAKLLDKEYGELYESMFVELRNDKEFYDFQMEINKVETQKNLNKLVIDFLWKPDCDGHCTPDHARAIFEVVKNDSLANIVSPRRGIDGGTEFKRMLLECFNNRIGFHWR